MVALFPQILRIGVMYEACQLSDVVGVDTFGALSRDYIKWIGQYIPAAKLYEPFSITVEWHYISSNLEPAMTTAGVKIVPTDTYDTAPRDLDIVIIGGPMPNFNPPAAEKFMKEAWMTTKTWLTTCVGSMWLARAGLLDGLHATTNRLFLPLAAILHPKVKWHDQRWVIEEKPYSGRKGGKGELWTGGAAMAGIDMMATYVLEKFDKKLVTEVCFAGLDLDPTIRGQYY